MKALVALLLLLPASGHLFAQSHSAVEAVQRFVFLDADGARLESGPKDPIWQVTLDNGEPPDEPVVLIERYRVSNTPEASSPARVVVTYTVVGVVRDSGRQVAYGPARKSELGSFVVLHDSDDWKISLAELRVPPHVQVSAYIKYLDSLMNSFADKDKSGARYKSLVHLRSTLAHRK